MAHTLEKALLNLQANSRFLANFLAQHPEEIELLTSSIHQEKNKAILHNELEVLWKKDFDGTLSSAQKILRHYRYREMCRIAARDLSHIAPYESLGNDMANLASISLEFALRTASHFHGPCENFVILGLGKLGGEDLNFSSDIDLFYFYDADELLQETHESYVKISETVTRLLHERTADGIVFRVDLDLRPEGKSGTLVNSLEGLLTYYEIKGASWERLALIKARPVAGNYEVGERFLKEIQPFVYPRSIDASTIRKIKDMKDKINYELKKLPSSFHVKLGQGGIREVEFFAHAFQLVYGGQKPELREKNTLKALEVLKNLGLVPAEEIRDLTEAYIFLRRIENRLQILDDRQTHALPTEPTELLALARQMGFEETENFLKTLEAKTKRVAECFERLAE